MSVDPQAPVLVGAGQLVHRPSPGGELVGPVSLAAEALRRAGQDSGTGERLLRRADSVRCVASTCWSYGDQAALVAEQLGPQPRETVQTVPFGGDGPQRLINDTAQSIADGEVEVALIAGAEAMATLRFAHRGGEPLAWPDQPTTVRPTRVVGLDRAPYTELEAAAGLIAPVYVYALLETAVQARASADRESHLRHIAALWSRFSEVAATNPYAWRPRALTPEEIATPSEANRQVSAPYPKLLTADIGVDQATGLIMCSARAAKHAGVPRDRWVFVLAGAHAHDEWFVSERAELAESPAIRAIARVALEHAGVSIDEVAHADLYSCFPSAVEIAAHELGLSLDDPDRPLTVTGGLTFAGGPGNNYTSHAVATLVARLREDPEAVGLTTALGWYVTKHAIGIYSARPPKQPFRQIDAGERMQRPPARPVSREYGGPATVEAYTVPYARDGAPEAAIVSALTPGGARVLARADDRGVADAMLRSDPLGWRISVAGPDAFTVDMS